MAKKKYRCYAIVTSSKYLGEVEADSEEEAKNEASEKFSDEMYISLCHQCASGIDLGDADIQVEEDK